MELSAHLHPPFSLVVRLFFLDFGFIQVKITRYGPFNDARHTRIYIHIQYTPRSFHYDSTSQQVDTASGLDIASWIDSMQR